jgi:hypothetical protein
MPAGMGQLTGFFPEDGGCRVLQYVCNELPNYTASITKDILETSVLDRYLKILKYFNKTRFNKTQNGNSGDNNINSKLHSKAMRTIRGDAAASV